MAKIVRTNSSGVPTTILEQGIVDATLSKNSNNAVRNSAIATKFEELQDEIKSMAKVYGMHIDGSESVPDSMITYLNDAVGMTPAYMDFTNDVFNYGSWKDVWFIRDCKPCILGADGSVVTYLQKDDFTKDLMGNTVSIDSTLTTENVMIEFPKIWMKIVPDTDTKSGSVYFSNVQVDSDYKDYPYIDENGNHKQHFYMPAFNGSLINNKLRSIADAQASDSLTAQQEVSYAQANGNGWYTETNGQVMLINLLLLLISKSTDTKSKFGQGLHTGGSADINRAFRTGVHKSKGMFYGTNSGAISSGSYGNAVKVFGIENWWGFQWQRYAGDMLVSGVRKVKLCNGTEDGSTVSAYNFDGTGYIDVGATPSGTSGGYISEMKFNEKGMHSKVSSGTASTYYCSGQWYDNAATCYSLRGGVSYHGGRVGAFCVFLLNHPGVAVWDRGASPSFV